VTPLGECRKRILLVEDDEDLRQSLCELLRGVEGCRVRAAGTAEGALRLARQEAPDLALIDLDLPDMPGDVLALTLAAATPRAQLVAVSGHATEPDRVRARIAGFERLLVKPFQIDELRDLIAERP